MTTTRHQSDSKYPAACADRLLGDEDDDVLGKQDRGGWISEELPLDRIG